MAAKEAEEAAAAKEAEEAAKKAEEAAVAAKKAAEWAAHLLEAVEQGNGPRVEVAPHMVVAEFRGVGQ